MSEDFGSDHHSVPGLPSGAAGYLARIILDGIDKAGYKETADRIRGLPDRASSVVAKAIELIAGKRQANQPVTQDDVEVLARAVAQNPLDAKKIASGMVADALTDAMGASEAAEDVLPSYLYIFNSVCTMMKLAQTSLVLNGFVHAEDCLSYWHLSGKDPKFSGHSPGHLSPIGLEVYLFWGCENSPEVRNALNEEILYNGGHLPGSRFDHRRDDSVALVKEVRGVAIRVARLDPDREEQKASERDVFGITSYNLPQSFDYRIAIGAPSLMPMFLSVFEALGPLQRHSAGVRDALRNVRQAEQNVPKPE